MKQYIIRLDDACEKRDKEKWDRVELLLDKYAVKPLVGIIPMCKDPAMEQYEFDRDFWQKVDLWQGKGWTISLHGYKHVYTTKDGGINPVNHKSEFAGVPPETQKEYIKNGVGILRQHGIEPRVFFAPAHTFDENTLKALKECSDIRVISDTVANDIYFKDCFTFVPQQAGSVRELPLKTVTFCYHPNMMNDQSFEKLEKFLIRHPNHIGFPLEQSERKYSLFDRVLSAVYFLRKQF